MSRYARQEILPKVGAEGQGKLAAATVLVIGAGGLGCPVLQYLAGAGIGHIKIVDPDTVERSNLHRQPLYGDASLGQPKAKAAQATLINLNSEIQITAYVKSLDPDNVDELLSGVDLVLDCADSFAATYILSDQCLQTKTPLISASVLGMNGYVGGFCGSAPSLRAVFPELPETLANCNSAGVLGPAVGVLGSLQAQMAIAVLLGLEPSPLGRLVSVDLATYTFGGFRFDTATEPQSVPFHFIAPAAITETDFVIELRDEVEAPVAVSPLAQRADVACFQVKAIVPPPHQRTVLCCRSGLRAWRAASCLQTYWQGSIALVAAGDNTTY